jgi:hypothetical protein
MLLGFSIATLAVVALVSFVLWSGRGILEHQRAGDVTKTEWMTVANGTFEFRGTVYRTAESLSVGLLQLQPKPQLVSLRWVTAGNDSPSSPMLATQLQQAREALQQANIAAPSAFMANEIFVAEPSAASKAR